MKEPAIRNISRSTKGKGKICRGYIETESEEEPDIHNVSRSAKGKSKIMITINQRMRRGLPSRTSQVQPGLRGKG
jgi:hypothetical protein